MDPGIMMQIYIVSGSIGSLFIVACTLMGQIHGGGGAHGAGADHGLTPTERGHWQTRCRRSGSKITD